MSVSTTTRRTVLAGLAASAVLAGQQRAADEKVLRFQFKDGSQRWLPGLSDYSADASRLNFTAEIRQVPPNYPAELRAYYLESHNTPDDLFMFLKRELSTLDGVETNRDYSVSIHVGFFSNVTDGGVGIGGSPGSDVYLKAGVSLAEPIAVLQDRGRYVGLSVDKGQQAKAEATFKFSARSRTVSLQRRVRNPTCSWNVSCTSQGSSAPTIGARCGLPWESSRASKV